MTKLVASVLTAFQDTVWPEVPERQTVVSSGVVTWMAEVRAQSASEARRVEKPYILALMTKECDGNAGESEGDGGMKNPNVNTARGKVPPQNRSRKHAPVLLFRAESGGGSGWMVLFGSPEISEIDCYTMSNARAIDGLATGC